jgi:hypothetical protein
MASASEIAYVVAEYEAIERLLGSNGGPDEERIRQELQRKQTALAVQLTELPAGSGLELALKALVLFDWVVVEDVLGELTSSLCKDVLRMFPPNIPGS